MKQCLSYICYSTGILWFDLGQIATKPILAVFGTEKCALQHTKSPLFPEKLAQQMSCSCEDSCVEYESNLDPFKKKCFGHPKISLYGDPGTWSHANTLCLHSMQVVEKIRAGDGKGKRLLVIDTDTEAEMKKRVSILISSVL